MQNTYVYMLAAVALLQLVLTLMLNSRVSKMISCLNSKNCEVNKTKSKAHRVAVAKEVKKIKKVSGSRASNFACTYPGCGFIGKNHTGLSAHMSGKQRFGLH